jgi:anti-anti-sigma factor
LAENEQLRRDAGDVPADLARLRTIWAERRAERRRAYTRSAGPARPDAVAGCETQRLGEESWLVRPDGAIDAFGTVELSARLDELLERGAHRVVVDLAQVTLMDSSGLGAVLRAFLLLQSTGGTLELVSGTPAVMRGFELTGLDKVLPLVERP